MNTKYINLKFISNNKEIEVGKGKSFRLLDIEGLESGAIDLMTTPNVGSDGSRVRNRRIGFRSIRVECEYVGPNKEEQRKFVAGFFNVHQGGILQIDYMGTEREIPYEIEGYNAKFENLYIPFKFIVHLYCPEPFLLDVMESQEEIVTWIGGFRFPFRFPVRFGTRGDTIINILNEGDVDTPLKLEIMGPATKPKILLRETGEFIRINTDLGAEDTLVVTTEFGNKRVELNGANAFNLIDLPDSTFFNLRTGDNVIVATTENINDNVKIKISYRNRYIGV